MPEKDLVILIFFFSLPHLSDCVSLEAHMFHPFGVNPSKPSLLRHSIKAAAAEGPATS